MNSLPPAPAAQTEAIAFLDDPASHGGRAVSRIDTHAAIVFLAGERAYKLKRAVRFPYLDFSTPALRRTACEAEVALNRRTAADLYLGVEPLVRRADGRLAIGGTGAPVDWLVVMRRFDGAGLFDRMAEDGRLTPALMRRLADRIAAFQADAAVRTGSGAARMRAVVEENLSELAAAPELFDPAAVARLATRSRAALERCAEMLDRRSGDGHVRHGHGDLHLRNIVLLDGEPTLFDALEFDEDLAVVDVLYDLAFLLMDLEHRSLRPLGNALLNRWLEATGDLAGLALLPLFISARAAIRAKVAVAAAAAQADPAAAATVRNEGRAYLDLALRALDPPAALLVAVGGLSGTGKSTLARGLAPQLGPMPGAVVLRSDTLRKRRHGVAEEVRLPATAYTPEETAAVYAALHEGCAAVLAAGQAAVADAVYAREDERQAVAAVAGAAGVPFTGFWLSAPAAVRAARVASRAPDASDADAEVVRRQEAYDIGALSWCRLDAAHPSAELLADAQKDVASLDLDRGGA